MDYINLKQSILNRFIWTRTNTIELFKVARNASILKYKPKYLIENHTENHDLLYQFQCVLTATDTQFRRLAKELHIQNGILVRKDLIIKKQDIKSIDISAFLKEQIDEATVILKKPVDFIKLMNMFVTIGEHEALHQGQLVVMFREVNVDFPQEFKTAWNL